MIVVFANERDESATRLVQRWTNRGATLMASSDLSRAGWKCESRNSSRSECVMGGMQHHSYEIEGVLIRRLAVVGSDLPHITPSDRSYVAAEMNAFLVYWLTALDCPILNRPTPRSLCGPGWYPEHWMQCAARAGLRVKAMKRAIKLSSVENPSWPKHEGPYVEITIVGEDCFGDVGSALARKALRVATMAGVQLVKLRFDGAGSDATFLAADVCPPIDDECIEQAVLGYFEAGSKSRALQVG